MNRSHGSEGKKRKSSAQSGQAIVIIALMMVSLLGITGLALDGGSLLLLQRRVQKVADLAALAASVEKCGGGSQADATAAAKNAALANEVADSAVQVKFDADTNTGQTGDIEVEINLPKNPYFIQVVYRGPMNAQASSITRCSTGVGSGAGYLLYGMSHVCQATLQVTSSGSYLGGTIISNNDLLLNNGSGTITGTAEHVAPITSGLSQDWTDWQNPVYGFQNHSIGGMPLFPHPDNMNAVIDRDAPDDTPALFNIEDFRPGGIYQQRYGSDYHILPPSGDYLYEDASRGLVDPNPDDGGVFYEWWQTSGERAIPREGIIYVPGDFGGSGGNTVFQNGNFESVDDGLTIVMEGAMNFSGGGKMSINAFADGLAIFSNKYNTPDAHTTTGNHCSEQQALTHMGSGIGAYWSGLIYAPGGYAQITTSNTATFHGSIVANKITLNVSSSHLEFEGSYTPAGDPSIYYVQ